ncbi:MAG: PH domain-containing protein [Oscillospiraceae bacterium]|jgi:uncharacterized membrane protein YdbT with pleckstrin-like domain|nr:PH domain-containing protein [Oscillospiraceae bacterium]
MIKSGRIKMIWQDRKRILGLPLTFTQYALSEDRVFVQTGLLNTRFEEALLYRIQDISLTVTLGQRIFQVGTVTLLSSDKTTPRLALKNIRNPMDVKEMIHEQVEEMKEARRMRLGELVSGDDEDDDDED